MVQSLAVVFLIGMDREGVGGSFFCVHKWIVHESIVSRYIRSLLLLKVIVI